MDEQNPNSAEVVTIKEATEKIKKWAEEKEFEKVKQGCEEILSVEPDNQEIKDLLETARTTLGETVEEPAPTPEAAAEKPEEATPQPEQPAPPEPVAATPEEIFKKPEVEAEKKEEAIKKEEAPPTTPPVAAPEAPTEAAKGAPEEPAPAKKGKKGIMILAIILLVIIVGLVIAFFLGWLNPLFEWILGLFGL